MPPFYLQGNVAYGCRAAPGICAALASRGHGAAAAAVKRFVWNEHCEGEKKLVRAGSMGRFQGKFGMVYICLYGFTWFYNDGLDGDG